MNNAETMRYRSKKRQINGDVYLNRVFTYYRINVFGEFNGRFSKFRAFMSVTTNKQRIYWPSHGWF